MANMVRASPPGAIITLHRILAGEVRLTNHKVLKEGHFGPLAELTVRQPKNCAKVEGFTGIHDGTWGNAEMQEAAQMDWDAFFFSL